jgi:hypothetical protein
MKKNKNVLLSLLGVFFFFSYISCAIGGDKITKEYIVRINDIEMNRSSAENLLNRIVGIGESKTAKIVNVNNGENIDVTKSTVVKEGTNIRIDNSKLVEEILGLFKVCSDKPNVFGEDISVLDNNGYELCMLKKNGNSSIYLCTNRSDNQITKILFIR